MRALFLALAAVGLLLPSIALARVGSVDLVEGVASRAHGGSEPRPLRGGDAIEAGDVLKVAANSNLRLTLSDGSVLMLGADSELFLDEIGRASCRERV